MLAVEAWVAQESSFAADPSASGASGYAALHTLEAISMHKVGRKNFDAPYGINRLRKVQKRVGPDGAELSVKLPLKGLAASAGESVAPGALDFLDFVLAAAFGAGTNVTGIGAASVTSTLFTQQTGDTVNVDDALCIYESGQNSNRPQWRVIDTEGVAGQYTVRTLAGTFTTAAISFGYRHYTPAVVPAVANGNSLAMYLELAGGSQWTLLGGRPSSFKLSMDAGGEASLDVTLMFDRRVRGSKASIPAVTAFAPPSIVGELSSFLWGTTEYETEKIEVEWTLGTADRKATSGANGRGNILARSADMKVTVVPPFGTNWEDDFDATTARRLELVLGNNAFAASLVNSCFLYSPACNAAAIDYVDSNNEPRQAMQFESIDAGYNAIPALRPYWRLCRA